MSQSMVQWLFRIGVGALAAIGDALLNHFQGIDVTGAGQWSVVAGIVVTALTWLVGKGVGKLNVQP